MVDISDALLDTLPYGSPAYNLALQEFRAKSRKEFQRDFRQGMMVTAALLGALAAGGYVAAQYKGVSEHLDAHAAVARELTGRQGAGIYLRF